MKELKFAIIGTGFWARYQLAAWGEVAGARCVALCNRTRSKAEELGREFGVSAIYENAEEMFAREKLNFVDIITDVGTHKLFTELAARHKVPVICQKPLAPSLGEAREMLEICRRAGVPLFVHENWRWQRPIRELKAALESGAIGEVFRARIDYCNSFPVFENQPFLRELEQFILTDMGTHILDVSRFLFGEANRLYCQPHKVHRDIKGEDAATVMMETSSRATVTCNLSYASRVEQDRFPEAFVFVEGTRGSVELAPDYWIRVTSEAGTQARRCPPPHYSWADARYALVHSSIVECNRHLFRALQTGSKAETSADDNLKTLELVFAAYESAARKQAVEL
ncbi:MAG TPA: Gfo/Idh/MocA family oxidoreductase [Verrucomicrobiae bacterium]